MKATAIPTTKPMTTTTTATKPTGATTGNIKRKTTAFTKNTCPMPEKPIVHRETFSASSAKSTTVTSTMVMITFPNSIGCWKNHPSHTTSQQSSINILVFSTLKLWKGW